MNNFQNKILIELEKLVIRRTDKIENKIFHIHYIDGEPINDVNINYINP